MKLQFTAKGIAALWLRGHAPDAEQSDIDSFATLLEGVWSDGVKIGLERAIETNGRSPTMGAAIAALEADVEDLKHSHPPEDPDALDIDLTEFAKKPIDPLML